MQRQPRISSGLGPAARRFRRALHLVELLALAAAPAATAVAGSTAPTIELTPLVNTSSTGDRTLSGVLITDADGVQTAPGLRPRLYFKKLLEDDAFVGNTSADNGWKFVETADTASPFSFTLDVSLLTGPLTAGAYVEYFVVAQDLDVPPNVGVNGGILAAPPASVDLQPAQAPVTERVNNYVVLAPIAGTKTVCASGCDYASLTKSGGAFEALTFSSLTDDLELVIGSDLDEDGLIPLRQWSEDGPGGYTLTIRPDSATLRTVSGSADFPGLLQLQGADRVVIDGRFDGSGKFLRFRNTNPSHPTIVLDSGATHNVIQFCTIEGGNTNDTFSGTIQFGFTPSGAISNSHNLIADCDIRDRSDAPGVPRCAIKGESADPPNEDNTIERCNIFNWTDVGVLVTANVGAGGWTIDSSSFFQTAPRSTRLVAIALQRGSGYQVLDNSIGGTAPGAGGAPLATSSSFVGIEFDQLEADSRSSVQGNTIKNIRSTLAGGESSNLVSVDGGAVDIGDLRGNTIGSSEPDERIELNGDVRGMFLRSDSAVTVSNNTIVNVGTTATADPSEGYTGIDVQGAGAFTIVDNTVANITNASAASSAGDAFVVGLDIGATGIQTVVGNTVSNVGLTNTDPVTERNNRAWGLFVAGSAAGTRVERNQITNVYASSASVGARADIVVGVQSQSASATYVNNMIALDGGAASDRLIRGILEASAAPAAVSYLFNSVHLHGTSTGANSTYAFRRLQDSTLTLRNNIFSNARTAATGFNVALANILGTADGWPASASDHNLLFNLEPSHLTQWLGGDAKNNGDLAAFRTSSGGDLDSVNGDPEFVSDVDLHLSGAGLAAAAGLPFGDVTTDIDGDARPDAEPDIGADEVPEEVIEVPAFRLTSATLLAWLAATVLLWPPRRGCRSAQAGPALRGTKPPKRSPLASFQSRASSFPGEM